MDDFGSASACTSLQEVLDFIRRHSGSVMERRQAAAFGLTLAARSDLSENQFFEDSRAVVDRVGAAKATIDNGAWHSLDVVEITSMILLSIQRFLDAQTIPCTEWPTPAEMVDAVDRFARSSLGKA